MHRLLWAKQKLHLVVRQKIFDTTIGSRFPNKKITAQYGGHSMPETGDNVAVEFGVTREQADTFAAQSQAKYQQAKTEGFFEGEITPIEVSQGKSYHLNWLVKMNIHVHLLILKPYLN